jgi:hypothetical protein
VEYPRPATLLTQNRELRREGIWNWTIPAWAGRLADGRTYNTCPSAGVCAKVCYALNGTYRFPSVKARHEANLAYVLDDLDGWREQMTREVSGSRHRNGWVRVHDAGDFFSNDYLVAWLDVARATPDTTFYAYTKEVDRFRRLAEPDAPDNFLWVYSYGGIQDAQLDQARDRVADVFPNPDHDTWPAAWSSQDASDLLAVIGPPLVGIPANRIPHYLKRMAGRRLSEWQAEADQERAARRGRAREAGDQSGDSNA